MASSSIMSPLSRRQLTDTHFFGVILTEVGLIQSDVFFGATYPWSCLGLIALLREIGIRVRSNSLVHGWLIPWFEPMTSS